MEASLGVRVQARFTCEKCCDFICCGYVTAPKLAEKKAAAPVSKSTESESSAMTEERNYVLSC